MSFYSCFVIVEKLSTVRVVLKRTRSPYTIQEPSPPPRFYIFAAAVVVKIVSPIDWCSGTLFKIKRGETQRRL